MAGRRMGNGVQWFINGWIVQRSTLARFLHFSEFLCHRQRWRGVQPTATHLFQGLQTDGHVQPTYIQSDMLETARREFSWLEMVVPLKLSDVFKVGFFVGAFYDN